MTEPFEISSSKWKLCTTCWRKAYYKYVLNLEPKSRAMPLAVGGLIHECLEAYYKEQDFKAIQKPLVEFKRSIQDMPDEERVLYKRVPQEVFRIMRGYHLHWRDLDNLTILKKDGEPIIERRFKVPLTKDVTLAFKMDLYVQNSFGEWVMDSKSHGGSLPSDDYRIGDVQSAVYLYGATQLGLHPVGIIWNYISSDAPSIPKMTKTRGMSKAKCRTDRSTFKEFLKKQGLDPEPYKEFMNTLSYKNFFRRVSKERPKILVARLLSEVVMVARQFQDYISRGERAFVRSLDWTCDRMCSDYRTLCLGELQGHDVDFIKETYYQPRRGEDGEERKAK